MGGVGLMILKPHIVRGYQANSAVRMGLIGCGKRGTAVATSFAQHTTSRYVALADIFPDQLAAGKSHFDGVADSLGYPGPDPKLLFRGAHAFEELAACKDIDAIQISTPPFFHVTHLEAAVTGRKHVYCEKPVGVDVTQTRRALEVARSGHGKVSMDVGFQIRSAPPFVELVKRIHDGALGKIVSITAHYYAPENTYPDRPKSMPADELRLRNWGWDLALSGDMIVEQDIHVIDICNWILGERPTSVYATGARTVLQHFGNNYDNYQVDYTYPNDVHVAFAAKQYGRDKYFDVSEQVFGSRGYSESPYSGPLHIVGENAWEYKRSAQTKGGSGEFAPNGMFSDNLSEADSEKEKSFIDSITSGNYHDQIAAGVESALSAMMARTSARQRRPITWDEYQASNEHYELGMNLNQFS